MPKMQSIIIILKPLAASVNHTSVFAVYKNMEGYKIVTALILLLSIIGSMDQSYH